MTKQTHILKTKHRIWKVEMQDRPDEFHMHVSWKGPWVLEEELEFNEWMGKMDLPYKMKNVSSTFADNGATVTHHPNGMIVLERPGFPTEITFGDPT